MSGCAICPCTHIQADEAWAFCGMKERNVPRDKQGVFGYGNVWVWTALCMDTKIVPSWVLGNRDQEAAHGAAVRPTKAAGPTASH